MYVGTQGEKLNIPEGSSIMNNINNSHQKDKEGKEDG